MTKLAGALVALCIGYALGAVTPVLADEVQRISWAKDAHGWTTLLAGSQHPYASMVRASVDRTSDISTKYQMAVGDHVCQVYATKGSTLLLTMFPGRSVEDVYSYSMATEAGGPLENIQLSYLPSTSASMAAKK